MIAGDIPTEVQDYELAREKAQRAREAVVERLQLTMPEDCVSTALGFFQDVYSTDQEVREDIAHIAIPLLASQYRAQAFAMLKGLDPTGTWWTPTMRCARQLFDAARELDGQTDPDEPKDA